MGTTNSNAPAPLSGFVFSTALLDDVRELVGDVRAVATMPERTFFTMYGHYDRALVLEALTEELATLLPGV